MLASEVERTYWQQHAPKTELVKFMIEACGGVKPVHKYMSNYVKNNAEPPVPLKSVWVLWSGLLEHLSSTDVNTLETLAKKDNLHQSIPLFVARESKRELLDKVRVCDSQSKARKF